MALKASANQQHASVLNSDQKPKLRNPKNAEQQYAKLDRISEEIANTYLQIHQTSETMRKLSYENVRRAKWIGDKLLHVRWEILKHGEYEKWVEQHFKLSTARVYTKLALPKNWAKILPKLTQWGGMSIRQAERLLEERPEEEKQDPRIQSAIKRLLAAFQRTVKRWPEAPLVRLANDPFFMGAIEETAKRRNKEIGKEKMEDSGT